MSFDKFAGVALFLIGQTVVAIWWAASINSDVNSLKNSTVSGERIVRLETQMNTLEGSNRDLKISIDTLAREIRRSRRDVN